MLRVVLWVRVPPPLGHAALHTAWGIVTVVTMIVNCIHMPLDGILLEFIQRTEIDDVVGPPYNPNNNNKLYVIYLYQYM